MTDPVLQPPRLPLSFDRDFKTSLQSHLHQFLLASAAILSASNQNRVALLVAAINDAVNGYLQGHPRDAYDALEKALVDVASELKAPTAESTGPFFRMRVAGHRGLSASDMFHIPFELRGRVSPQRFSITGLPCLYTARSLYVCWEELGRPPLHSVQASAIRTREGRDLRLLKLALTSTAQSERDWLCYPLIAACTVQSRPEDSFRPEYIVPQLLLQWLTRSDDFDGIECISTHVSMENDPSLTTNVVFPVRNVADSGHCAKLTGLFDLTDPLAWEFAVASGLEGESGRPSGKLHHGDWAISYNESLFAYVESLLSQRPSVRLVANGKLN